MRFIKIIFYLFIITNSYRSAVFAQSKTPARAPKRPIQTKAAANPTPEKSFAQRNYKELHFGLNLITNRFTLDVAGSKAAMRTQLQGLSFTYTFYRPSQNIMWLYSYGFGATLGVAKASPDPFHAPFDGYEVKNKTWFMGSFLPGIDFRRSQRARVGIFTPVVFRILDFGYDENVAKVFDDDPFSVGVGFRYINALSIRDSVSVSFTHQIIWAASTWELVWQRRLGL